MHASPRSSDARRSARHIVARAVLATAAAVLAIAPAQAEQRQAQGNASSVSASVDFRIVIPETVRFVESREQRGATRQFTSRSVERIDGREVTTVARP